MHPPAHDLAALGRIYQLESNLEWDSLLRTAEFAEAFTFTVLLVPDSAGAELCRQRLREKLREFGRGELEDYSPQATGDWPAVLQRLVHGRSKPGTSVVWVAAAVYEREADEADYADYAAWRESWRYAATQINQFRNLLEAGVGCLLIFVGCDWVKPVLRDCAPDLWSIRTGVIEIRPPVRPSLSVPLGPPWDSAAVSSNAPDAEMALEQAEALRGRPGHELALARALLRAGEGLSARFEWLKAIPLLREALELRRKYGSEREVLEAIQGLWDPLYRTGSLEEASALAAECSKLAEGLKDRRALALALRSQAWVMARQGSLQKAMALHNQQEAIHRELGDKSGLQASLGNQAGILQAWGNLDEAMALHKQEEAICRELGDKSGLLRSLGNQALILQAWGKLDEAMALLKQLEAICRELGDKSGLQASLGNQAVILQAWGELDGAMALHKQQEAICRELGDKSGLAYSLANQDQLHRQSQPPDLPQARLLLTEAIRLVAEVGMPRERDLFQGWFEEIHIPAK